MRNGVLPRSMFQTRKPKRAGRPIWKQAEEFMRWLRKLPCARCEAAPGDLNNPVVSAHVDMAGGKGIGSKVADKHCIPLCDSCHKEQHQVGWLTFEKRLPLADAIALACVYWTEWPGRIAWERELADREQAGEPMRGRL